MYSELELLLRWLKTPKSSDSPPVLLDVGAHVGSFLLPFAQAGWRVIAFEPEPKNRQMLAANCANLPLVEIVAQAVSDVDGQTIPFYVSAEHWGLHTLKPFHPTHKPTIEVETVRLDRVCAERGLEAVTLMKIDIEGADFLAIKGFDFERYRPTLMCEFMDDCSQANFGYTHHDVVAYMQPQGYVAFVSEWSPIVEYGRADAPRQAEAQHHFVSCQRYLPKHTPAWGNLIFVPEAQAAAFEAVLRVYLADLQRTARTTQIKRWLARIPGVLPLYHLIKSRSPLTTALRQAKAKFKHLWKR